MEIEDEMKFYTHIKDEVERLEKAPFKPINTAQALVEMRSLVSTYKKKQRALTHTNFIISRNWKKKGSLFYKQFGVYNIYIRKSRKDVPTALQNLRTLKWITDMIARVKTDVSSGELTKIALSLPEFTTGLISKTIFAASQGTVLYKRPFSLTDMGVNMDSAGIKSSWEDNSIQSQSQKQTQKQTQRLVRIRAQILNRAFITTPFYIFVEYKKEWFFDFVHQPKKPAIA